MNTKRWSCLFGLVILVSLAYCSAGCAGRPTNTRLASEAGFESSSVSASGDEGVLEWEGKRTSAPVTPIEQADGTIVIDIEALIDGRDRLIIKQNTIQWDHRDWDPVGRHQGRNEPTIISTAQKGSRRMDRVEWMPEWPAGATGGCNSKQAFSSTFQELKPALPQSAMNVTLTPLHCRENVNITQEPSAENDYTLIVEFDDQQTDGSDQYQVRIAIMCSEVQTESEGSSVSSGDTRVDEKSNDTRDDGSSDVISAGPEDDTPIDQAHGRIVIDIEALIDGIDLLIIKQNTIQWDHKDYAKVGQHGNRNEPTIISAAEEGSQLMDRVEWMPAWPSEVTREVYSPAVSSKFQDLRPALPQSAMGVTLKPLKCRGSVNIEQHPSAENDYTLIVKFNDNHEDGSEWYKLRIVVAGPSLQIERTADPKGDTSIEQTDGDMVIDVEALIDGRSLLMIKESTLQWDNKKCALVGRHDARNEPTIISTAQKGSRRMDRVEWIPQWPEKALRGGCYRQAVSSTFQDLKPALPRSAIKATLIPRDCRGEVSVQEQPSAENDYTLIVEFDDMPKGGSEWYKLRIVLTDAESQPEAKPGSVSSGNDAVSAERKDETPIDQADGNIVIDVEALIDGTDLLIVKQNTIQWDHQKHELVGRHAGRNEPTIISTAQKRTKRMGRVEWTPEWPAGAVTRSCSRQGCCTKSTKRVVSSKFEDFKPALPQSAMQVTLIPLKCRGCVTIEQEPAAENDYTLIVKFDDNKTGGSDWYKVRIVVADAVPQAETKPSSVSSSDGEGGARAKAEMAVRRPSIALEKEP